MISYQTYKVLHLFGIALLLLGLGTVLGAFSVSAAVKGKVKLLGFLTHGLGLFLVILGGFGMLARLGIINGLPGWIYGKLVVWILLGLGISLAKRKSQWGFVLSFLFAALVGTATWLAVSKPF